MIEGTVVIVTGKFDERVRINEEGNTIGTVVKCGSGEVWVMLPDGNIWVGKEYLVYPVEVESEELLEDEQCTTD
jgi:hypothetical protein